MKSKQVLLTFFVIVTFVLYSLQQRHDAGGVISSIGKATTATNTTSQASQQSSSSQTAGSSTSSASSNSSKYKDGSYTGSVADAFYGNIQVLATISGGRITDVVFLDHPSDQSDSQRINSVAMPLLKQEAIQAQSANVDGVSGATDTSQAFIQSLSTALQKAQA